MLVSVVIPAYQCAGLIRETLDSVLAQSFHDHEIIVVNDGSPDTDLLERALGPYEEKIHYIKQANCGPSSARNAGILRARGKYVALLDSDDIWLDNHLENHLSKLLQDSSLGLVYSDYFICKEGAPVEKASDREPQSPPFDFRGLLLGTCAIGTSSVVVSRQVVIDAGLFDERFRRCEDFDLWLRIASRGTSIGYSERATLCHRVRNGLSADRYLLKRARIEVYEKISSTLNMPEQEQKLIRTLIQKNEADCEVDLAKQFLQDQEYGKALGATTRALALKDDWKLRMAVLGLRRFPRWLRRCYRLCQSLTQWKKRVGRTGLRLHLDPLVSVRNELLLRKDYPVNRETTPQ